MVILKPCAFQSCEMSRANVMQQLTRGGPGMYFDIVSDAFREDTRCDQTLKFITLLDKTLVNPDTEILVYM